MTLAGPHALHLSLRPTGVRCRRLSGEHLACAWRFGHGRRAAPLGRHHEQGSVVHATEHTGEAAAVEVNGLQHLAALADAHATLVGNVAVPDGSFGVEANAVWDAVAEVGPHAPIRQAAVFLDVEGCEPIPLGVC